MKIKNWMNFIKMKLKNNKVIIKVMIREEKRLSKRT